MKVFKKTKPGPDSILGQIFSFLLKALVVLGVFTLVFSLTNMM